VTRANNWATGPVLVAAVLLASAMVAVGAVYNPKYCVLGVIALILVAVTMANLTYGVAGLTVLAFFDTVPGLGGESFSKPFGLVLVISWLAAIAGGASQVRLLTRDQPILAYLLTAFVVWAAASAAWSADPSTTVSNTVRLALDVILVFVTYSAVRNREDLLVIVWAFLAGSFLISVVAIAGSRGQGGRLTGGVLDPNYLAAALACSIIVGSFLLPSTRSLARVVLVGFIATDLIALTLTQSRGGLIALGAAMFIACVVAGPARPQAISLVVVITAVGIAYFAVVAPAVVRERITNISEQGSAGRSDTWQIAFQVGSHHPLAGVGLANFPVVEANYISNSIDILKAQEVLNTRLVVHNTYLELFAELGVIGLALFLAILATTMAAAWRGVALMKSTSVRLGLVGRGLIAGTAGLLVAYVFLSGEYEKQLWLLLGLLATLPNVARSELDRASAGERFTI
jgi:O-antigen ligase